jgi:hypothetical protein
MRVFWGPYTEKDEIQCPIIEKVTGLYIQQHPSVLKAATMAKNWHAAAW